uniref:Cysteine and histidine-rich domain-containing protein 1 n=1 Tax=Steinernema glaseri TaxID=37863 RepID=A0A1I8AT20_9BILA
MTLTLVTNSFSMSTVEKQENDVIARNGLNQAARERASKQPLIPIKVKVTPGAEALLEQLKTGGSSSDSADALEVGAPCRNNSCSATYNGPDSSKADCVHHPGVPIFHEGMKYWSCCQKKTSDFGNFLDQQGCTTGHHVFTKVETVKAVRQDWFNSGSLCHVNLYCKGAIPAQCKFESNGFLLKACVTYANGQKESLFDFDLFGQIEVENSQIVISERKVEMILKKVEPVSWPTLHYEPSNEQADPHENDVIAWNGLNQPTQERDTEQPLIPIKVRVTSGAEALLEQLKTGMNIGEGSNALEVGAPCRNNSCNETYNGPDSSKTNCVHHPGVAIFHEGMKYWSCCKKKTSDFGNFLDQQGCTTGDHVFIKVETVKAVRQDWFNSGSFCHVNLYCKGAIPAQSKFESNGFLLKACVTYANGQKESAFDFDLFGEIEVENSEIVISERKVEMVLKKVEPVSWPKLANDPVENATEELEAEA